MTTFKRSFHQENEELSNILNDVNAVLIRKPTSSLFEQYAGISELTRTSYNLQKVGVLTIGLFSPYPPVRELAANALDQSYGLGITSKEVLKLLDQEQAELKNTLNGIDRSAFTFLIGQMDKLSKQKRRVGTDKVDYGSQHILIILRELGHWMNALLPSSVVNTHPLKELLESQAHRKSLPMIQRCLDSEDVYCRRRAILLIGELNLSLQWEQQNFDLILEQIDHPENRQDYLVTWDGLKALTVIVQQDASLQPRMVQVLQKFFHLRTYQVGDPELAEKHRYHTKTYCIESLGILGQYNEVRKLLLQIDLLQKDHQRFVTNVKEELVKALIHIYYHQDIELFPSLTLQQQKVIIYLIDWVNSKNRYVKQAAQSFFNQLPPPHHFRITNYLQQYLFKTIDLTLRSTQQLEKRLIVWRNIATVLGILFNRLDTLALKLVREKTNQAAILDERSKLINIGKVTLNRLCESFLQIVSHESLQAFKLFKLAMQESLWTLYELSPNIQSPTSLTLEAIATLSSLEQDEHCRPILILLRATLTNLGEISHVGQQDDELVRCCIEIEQLIQSRGQRGVLSARTIDRLIKDMGKKDGIPDRLIDRLIPVLAEMHTPEAIDLNKKLIALNDNDGSKPFVLKLRESLCGYQCYELRDVLVDLLLRDLNRRYHNRQGARLGYLNLLRASEYRQQQAAQGHLSYQAIDPLIQKVLTGLDEIQSEFTRQELPILSSDEIKTGDYQPYHVVKFGAAAQNINSLLYQVKTLEAKQNSFTTYLRSIPGEGAWIFLDRTLTDAEAIAQMIQTLGKTNDDLTVLRGSYRIFGRIERIAEDRSGVYVDIGLQEFPPKYVRDRQLLGDRRLESDDSNRLQELVGKVLAFQVSVCIDMQNHQIQELELDGREAMINSNRNPKQNIVKQGRLVGFSDDLADAAAFFQVEGESQLITIRLPELSWRKDSDWLENWKIQLDERRDELFTISCNPEATGWSLRSNLPQYEHLLQYLFTENLNQNSSSKELTYVKSSSDGFIFEIKPGILCYLPEERLLELNPEGEDYNFLLSGKTIKPGTRLSMIFTAQSIQGNLEPIFSVIRVQPVGEMPTKGMRIEGTLQPLDESPTKYRLSPNPIEQPPGYDLSRHILVFKSLPESIECGSEVSGRLRDDVNPHQKMLVLDYVDNTSDLLEVGQSYLCTVHAEPKSGYLLLRYNNVKGLLYERAMTYGHLPVIPNYSRNMRLRVNVEKQETRKREETLTVDLNLFNELGLESTNATKSGQVIDVQQDIVSFEDGSRQLVKFDLKYLRSTKHTKIYPSDRITFQRLTQDRLKIDIVSQQTFFTLRPGLNQAWADYQDVLKGNKVYRCIYISSYGQYCLFEYQMRGLAPSFFQVSKRSIPQIKEYECYVGDYLTLKLSAQGEIQIEQYEAGPLRVAENPQKCGDLSQIFWLERYAPIKVLNAKMQMSAIVAGMPRDNGVSIKLQHLQIDSIISIPLVENLQAFYRCNDMNYEEEQQLRRRQIDRLTPFNVVLTQPPNLQNQQLRLGVESAALTNRRPQQTDVHTVKNQILSYEREWKQNPNFTVVGTICQYVAEEGAFQVRLDDLSEYQTLDYCWLPIEEVSASRVHTYRSVEDFGDKLTHTFSIISIDPKSPELEVSLIKNCTRLDFDKALEKFEWEDNWLFKQATFLQIATPAYQPSSDLPLVIQENSEVQNKSVQDSNIYSDINKDSTAQEIVTVSLPVQSTEMENQVSSSVKSDISDRPSPRKLSRLTVVSNQLVIIEIRPGLVISVPIERFYVEGIKYQAGGAEFGLQLGDQIMMRLLWDRQQKHHTLNVVQFIQADVNTLSNPQKILYGRIIQESKDNQLGKLKVEGYQADCFIHPDYHNQLESLAKLNRILLRFTNSPVENDDMSGIRLYFKPIEPSSLREGDRLRVKYSGVMGFPANRLRVTFGEGSEGYIYRSDVSYQLGFNLNQLKIKPGEEFEYAAIKQSNNPEAGIRLSLKMKPVLQGLSYFLLQDVGETVRGIVLPNNQDNRPDYIDLEIQINVIVRLPMSIVEQSERHKLKPGNVLVFNVSVNRQSFSVNLHLKAIEENNVQRYLTSGMLVRVELISVISISSKPEEPKYSWRFALPDYGNLEGKLETSEAFRQDIGYQDLRLKVKWVPENPNHAIQLCDRSMKDAQKMLQVDSHISNRIKLIGGDGKFSYLRDDCATYHIDCRISYLREHFQPRDIVVVTSHKNQISLRYNSRFRAENLNRPLPFQFLRQALQLTDLTVNKTFDLTYVCTEPISNRQEEQVFELAPGKLFAIPTTRFSFCNYEATKSLKSLFERLLPGDRLTVTLQQVEERGLELERVSIEHIQRCVLHNLFPNQIIEAQVQEVIEAAVGTISGIVILAKQLPLEYFIPLPPDKKTIDYPIGQTVWLMVKSVEEQVIKLDLIDKEKAIECLNQATYEEPLVVFVQFDDRLKEANNLDIEILDLPCRVYLSQLTWTDRPIAQHINEVLAPNQFGMWLAVFRSKENKYPHIRPKWIYERSIDKLREHRKRYPYELLQARVLKCNCSQTGTDSVLLEVDGIKTLISHTQLVQGAQSEPCLSPGMWVSVQIQSVKYDPRDSKQSILSVASPGNFEIGSISQPFSAEVRFTLDHGLIFAVKQTLGYVSNRELGWSKDMKAADLFDPGDIIQVYPPEKKSREKKFSLKHHSQIQAYRSGQEINAQSLKTSEQGVYVKIAKNSKVQASSYLFALISYPSTDFELSGDNLVLRIEDIDENQKILSFRVLRESTGLNLASHEASMETIQKQLNRFYLTTLTQFDAHLQQLIRTLKQSKHKDRKTLLTDLMEQCMIPATYANLRGLIRRFSKDATLRSVWLEFTDCHLTNEIGFILAQVARRIDRLDLQEIPVDLQPLCHYAIGITPMFETDSTSISDLEALEHLWLAYKLDKSIEIAIALLLLYDRMECWELRHATLKEIVIQISQNLQGLFKLPAPIEIEQESYGKDWKKYLPGMNQELKETANTVKTIRDEYFCLGKITDAEHRYREIWDKTRLVGALMPELPLNMALCRVLQSDWQGALDCLVQTDSILSQPKHQESFQTTRRAYLQLNLYIHYQLGRFPQLQDILQTSYKENPSVSIETTLAYLFFVSDKWQLCKETLTAIPASTSSLKQNTNALEYLLLRLYWQYIESEGSTVEHATDLHRLFTQGDYPEICPDRSSKLYLMAQDPKNIDALLENGKQYDIPEYVLDYQNSIELRHVQSFVDVALSTAKISEAEKILKRVGNFQQTETDSDLDNLLLQLNQMVDLLKSPDIISRQLNDLQIFDRTSDYVLSLIERWLRSPMHRVVGGKKLSLLLSEHPALRSFCWLQPDIREYLWQILDRSLDYGTITELIPANLLMGNENGQILATLVALKSNGYFSSNQTILRDVIDKLPPCPLKDERLNDYQRALANYNQAITINPKDSEAYSNRAILKYNKLNDYQGALADYNEAIMINPQYFKAYGNRAVLKYTKLNDYQGALADCNQAIIINPQYSQAYSNRAVLKYTKLNDQTGAIQDLRQAAWLYREQGNTQGLQAAISTLKQLGAAE
jgi:tetratricopeptide (TPR) repeat protein